MSKIIPRFAPSKAIYLILNMKKNNYYILSLALLVFMFINACGSGDADKDGFKTTESGIKYKIIGGGKGEKIKGGDYLDFQMVIKDANDSIVQNSYDKEQNPEGAFLNRPFPKDSTKGTIIEAIMMLAKGDSAIFKISTDSILAQNKRMGEESIKTMREQMDAQLKQAPSDSAKMQIQKMYEGQIQMLESQMNQENPQLPKGKFITYVIKILDVKNEERVKKDQEEAMKKREEEAEALKKTQDKEIKDYLKKNKLEAKSTTSGLHYVITKEGDGEKPQAGDSVKVRYTGKLISGKVFDTSEEDVAKKNEMFNPERDYKTPFSFQLGRRQVIAGWDEGLSLLNKGSKATLLIPAHLGYGDRGTPNGVIPPNSILVFEVELLK